MSFICAFCSEISTRWFADAIDMMLCFAQVGWGGLIVFFRLRFNMLLYPLGSNLNRASVALESRSFHRLGYELDVLDEFGKPSLAVAGRLRRALGKEGLRSKNV